MHGGDIAGIVIGVLLSVVVIGILFYYRDKIFRDDFYSFLLPDDTVTNSYKNSQLDKEVKNPILKRQRFYHESIINDIENHYPSKELSVKGNNNLNDRNSLDESNKSSKSNEDYEDSNIENVMTDGVVKSGYLNKKSTRGIWLKRWFFIKDGKLFYTHSESDFYDKNDVEAVLVANLVISTTKVINSREFQIISPGSRNSLSGGGLYDLQTINEYERNDDWIAIINKQIEGSLTQTDFSSSDIDKNNTILFAPNKKILNDLKKSNQVCADCDQIDPEWASINLCIMICIECSGVHRNLGVHFSKVRSITLDKWTPPSIELLCSFGNKKSNLLWEGSLLEFENSLNHSIDSDVNGDLPVDHGTTVQLVSYDDDIPKDDNLIENRMTSSQFDSVESTSNNNSLMPITNKSIKITKDSTREEREKYITDKYIMKLYISSSIKQITEVDANILILQASATGNVNSLMKSIIANANIQTTWISNEFDTLKTPLHLAVEGDHILCVEILCQCNANILSADYTGKTSLDIAMTRGKREIIDLLNHHLK